MTPHTYIICSVDGYYNISREIVRRGEGMRLRWKRGIREGTDIMVSGDREIGRG